MQDSIEVQPEIKENKFRNNLVDLLQSIVIAVSLCIVIYVVFATPNQIEGQSMEPNFDNGQIVLTSKIHQWLGGTDFGKSIGLDYQRGDVVVFQKPGFNDFIKRVIGLPGDKVALKNGEVYINDQRLDESSYLPAGTVTSGGNFLIEDGDPVTVPADSYFVIGDNRGNSHDSRYEDITFIKREWFKGKVLLRYWPLDKFEIVNH